MIKVNIKKENGVVESITLTGHANYGNVGKDIVCAGVSSALTTTVNACLSLNNDSIKYIEEKTFTLKNIKKDDTTNKLLENFIEILKSIENDYKENIKIKEE